MLYASPPISSNQRHRGSLDWDRGVTESARRASCADAATLADSDHVSSTSWSRLSYDMLDEHRGAAAVVFEAWPITSRSGPRHADGDVPPRCAINSPAQAPVSTHRLLSLSFWPRPVGLLGGGCDKAMASHAALVTPGPGASAPPTGRSSNPRSTRARGVGEAWHARSVRLPCKARRAQTPAHRLRVIGHAPAMGP